MSAALRMRFAMARVMTLTLVRDRGALVMAFALPALVFTIFAVIFSGASGGDLNISMGVVDEQDTAQSRRLVRALGKSPGLAIESLGTNEAQALVQRVREGSADVGLLIKASELPLDNEDSWPAITLLTDPTRDIAVSVVLGALNQAFNASVPEALVGAVMREADTRRLVSLSDEQRKKLDRGLRVMRKLDRPPPMTKREPFFERRQVVDAGTSPLSVAYYAGAVAIMFGLFSSLNGAVRLIEERDSGLLGRLAVGRGGIGAVVDGKAIFLVGKVLVQITIIFAVAWLGFGVDVPSNFGGWLVVTLMTAIACAGLSLGFVSLCATRQQAQDLGSFAILILSAIGGSMVPRFMMPSFIQDIGWLTPHTWVLESYAMVLWRGGDVASLAPPLLALGASGFAGVMVARRCVGLGR
jgi:ABC-2 type transport system permease protein